MRQGLHTSQRLESGLRVDPKLVRSNEVHRLCGDPALLVRTVGELPNIPLRDTLAWMLE